MERAMGIEPTSEAWEASILPLYDALSFFSVFRLYITARLLVQTGHGHFRSSNCTPERCPIIRIESRLDLHVIDGACIYVAPAPPARDLTPDHRTDIASK